MLLVRAEMTLADGRLLGGFITPQHNGESPDLGTTQPQLFLPSGSRVEIWDGMFQRPLSRRTIVYDELGENPSSIFPIQFRVEDGLTTGQVSGQIPGFCWCPNGNSRIEVYF